jgi:NADH-quinone oxidoreductase subunit N
VFPLLESSLLTESVIKGIGTSLTHFYPELTLCIFACILLLLDLVTREENSHRMAWPAVFGLVFALFLAVGPGTGHDLEITKPLFQNMIASDRFAAFFKIIFVFGSLVAIVLTYHSRQFFKKRMGEYYSLMFCSVVGMCLMASSTDFLMMFLAIELVSIPSYVLVGYFRQESREGSEACIKYLLYGAFSSGIMLFGVSLIYGLTGTTKFSGIAVLLDSSNHDSTLMLAVASLMTFAGFGYKLAAAPFHFWAPDVYQGAPTPITAWLSVASKAAGIAAFVRFLGAFAPTYHFGSFDWSFAIMVIAAITMTVGNVQALLQTNVKRMLAYSSVAHVGFIMMGLSNMGGTIRQVAEVEGAQAVHEVLDFANQSGELSGASAVAFYTFAYMWMNLGAFAIVLAISNRYGGEEIKNFVGLGERSPALAIAMAIYLFAFIGLPPTVGFTGKMQLFMVAINKGGWGIALAIVAGLNTAVSVYYYMRLIRAMFLENYGDPAHREPLAIAPGLSMVCLLLAMPVLGFGVFFNSLGVYTQELSMFLR